MVDEHNEQVVLASPEQYAIWLAHETSEWSGAAYNTCAAFRADTTLKTDDFAQSFKNIVELYPVLRSQFFVESGILKARIASVDEMGEIAEWTVLEKGEQLSLKLEELSNRKFQLEVGPLLKIYFIQEQAGDTVVLIVIHHIISDAISFSFLLEDLFSLYSECQYSEGKRQAEVSRRDGYLDFVGRRTLAKVSDGLEDAVNELESDYDNTIAEEPLFVSLSPRAEPKTISIVIDETRTAEVREFAKRQHTTPLCVLLAAFLQMSMRLTGKEKLIVSLPMSLRTGPVERRALGCFVNSVPVMLKGRVNDSFTDAVKNTKNAVLQGMKRRSVPTTNIREALGRRKSVPVSSLHTQFALHQANAASKVAPIILPGPKLRSIEIAGVKIQPILVDQQIGQFPLSVDFLDHGECISGYFKFEKLDADPLFTDVVRYPNVLESLMAAPDQRCSELIRDTLDAEKEVYEVRSSVEKNHKRETFVDAFLRNKCQTPEATAVIENEKRWSYREIAELSRNVARGMQECGIRKGDIVPVIGKPGINNLLATIGLWQVGAVYAPVSNDQPVARIRKVAELVRASCIVGVEPQEGRSEVRKIATYRSVEELERLGRNIGPANRMYLSRPTDIAYIFFTSGSTGEPKGVVVSHSAFQSFLVQSRDCLKFDETDCFLWTTKTTFDISLLEMLGPLYAGGTTAVGSEDLIFDDTRLNDYLEKVDATVLQMTPSGYRILFSTGWRPTRELKLLCGGEMLDATLAEELCERSNDVWNAYGPTEATIWVSYCSVLPIIRNSQFRCATIPIGEPIGGVELQILHPEKLDHVPFGVEGELFIAGSSLAEGYLNDDAKTEKNFVNLTLAKKGERETSRRYYRTGDRARYVGCGQIEITGRLDHQVKLHGHRIELGEIEAALYQLQGVRAAVVELQKPNTQEAVLVAYVVSDEKAKIEFESIQAHLRRQLPRYSVPNRYLQIGTMPLNASGKVARKELSRQEVIQTFPEKSVSRENGKSGMFSKVEKIWAATLGHDNFHDKSDFFDVGGTSVLAATLVSEVEARTGRKIPLSKFIQSRTIEKMVGLMQQGERAEIESNEVEIVELRAGTHEDEVIVFVHPIGGTLSCYETLLEKLPREFAIVGIQRLGGIREASILELATTYERLLDKFCDEQKREVSAVVGWSFGGILSYEIGGLLQRRRKRNVVSLSIEGYPTKSAESAEELWWHLRTIFQIGGTSSAPNGARNREELLRVFRQEIRNGKYGDKFASGGSYSALDRILVELERNEKLLKQYEPTQKGVETIVVAAELSLTEASQARLGIGKFNPDLLIVVPGADHYSILNDPFIDNYLVEGLVDRITREAEHVN